MLGRHPAGHDEADHRGQRQHAADGSDHERDRRDQGEHRQHRGQGAPEAGPGDGVGGRAHPEAEAQGRPGQHQRPPEQHHHEHGEHGERRQQRHHRAHPATNGHRLHLPPFPADRCILAGPGEQGKPMVAGSR
jgi:hypothetical protein